MNRLFFALGALFMIFLVGCESMESKPEVQGRIVSGTILGPDGFSFKIPYGFKVYDEEAAEETPGVEVIKKFADRYLQTGASPYYVVLSRDNVYLAFIPSKHYLQAGTTVRARPPSGPMYSTLSETEQLVKLQNFLEDIRYNDETCVDVKVETVVDRGVPLGIWSGYIQNENGSRVSIFSIIRLGKEYEIYTVLGISSGVIRDSAIFSGRDILTKMELE